MSFDNVELTKTCSVGVIEKSKKHLFKRFMTEMTVYENEQSTDGANFNEAFCSSEESDWQGPESNYMKASFSENNEDDEFEHKKYEDYETL